MRTLPF